MRSKNIPVGELNESGVHLLSAVSLETLESVKRVLLAELSKGGWHWADEEDMDAARGFVVAIALAVEEGEKDEELGSD